MDELLGSIHYNPNGDLIVSSSYLTYQFWVGFVAHIQNESEYMKQKISQRSHLMLSSLKSGKHFETGVCDARWQSSERVLVGTENGEVILFKLNDPTIAENYFERVFTKQEHDNMVLCIDTKYDSELAISGSDDARIKIWDVDQEISTRTYSAHEYSICSITISPHSSKMFLSCSEDERAFLWDTRKEKPALSLKHQLNGHPSASNWSHIDSNIIAFGSETGQIGIYDIRLISDKPYLINKTHNRYVRQVRFHDKLNLIASCSEDCKLTVNRIVGSSVLNDPHLTELYSFDHFDYVTGISWNPKKDNELVSCSWDGRVLTHEFNFKDVNGH